MRKKIINFCIIALCIISIGLGFYFGIKSKEVNKLITQINNLNEQIEKLSNENNKYVESNLQLEEELMVTKNELGTCETIKADLNKQIENLKKNQ